MKKTRYKLKMYSLRVRDAVEPTQEDICSPEEAKPIVRAYFRSVRDDRERFIVLGLTTRNGFLGISEVSCGGATSTYVDPKVLFRTLLMMGATRFILSHSHPSGDATPSREDITLTRTLKQAGELLELDCLDHLIVGDATGAIVSLAETGQLE